MALTGVDRETALDILSMYLNQTKTLLDDVQIAFEKTPPQWEDIKMLLHKLKGSSGNVRQELFYELAIMGESASKGEDALVLSSLIKKANTLQHKLSEALENEMCRK